MTFASLLFNQLIPMQLTDLTHSPFKMCSPCCRVLITITTLTNRPEETPCILLSPES